MNPHHVEALLWAVSELEQAAIDPTDECYPHLLALRSLAQDATVASYAFDSSKSALIAFMRRHRLTLPHKEFGLWRMLLPEQQVAGVVNALPESRGILRATNGILCYIEKADGTLYGPAHLESFEPDVKETPFFVLTKKRSGKKSEADKILESIGL